MSFRQPDRPGLYPADRSESDRLLDAARAAPDAAAPRPDQAAQRRGDTAARQGQAAQRGDGTAARGDLAGDRGSSGGPGRPVGDPLARLLAAAAGPTRPGELAGEEAALAAFRAARAAPAAVSARTPRRLTVGAVAWIGALAVTATAGVAVAAANLDRAGEPAPPPASSTAPASPTDPGATTPGLTGSGPGGSPSPIPAPTVTPGGAGPSGPARPGTPGADTRSPGRTTGPGQSGAGARLPGLCRAYLAKSAAQRERALEESGFAPLVVAAGGAAEVESFCRDLLSGADSGRAPTVNPSHPGRPDRGGAEAAGGELPGAAPAAATPPSRPGRPTTKRLLRQGERNPSARQRMGASWTPGPVSVTKRRHRFGRQSTSAGGIVSW
ncbi:hypothetical protein ACH4OY_11520 [Micromonospora rubida]|uniref:Uncharacterized protein n=1 Tax=Micromonospora rubida TaxID=2697657 RepID=A0ABW7SM51_9ACTN